MFDDSDSGKKRDGVCRQIDGEEQETLLSSKQADMTKISRVKLHVPRNTFRRIVHSVG